jgi:hypothetical protein
MSIQSSMSIKSMSIKLMTSADESQFISL